MGVLTRPREDLIEQALELARTWCAGHVIDGAPALAHAVKVAAVLEEHTDKVPSEVFAGVLLHDAPDLGPVGEWEQIVAGLCRGRVLEVVRKLEAEHRAMDAYVTVPQSQAGRIDALGSTGPSVLLALVADKLVSITYVLSQAEAAENPCAYWAVRKSFLGCVPLFAEFAGAAAPYLPPPMAKALDVLLGRVPGARDW